MNIINAIYYASHIYINIYIYITAEDKEEKKKQINAASASYLKGEKILCVKA